MTALLRKILVFMLTLIPLFLLFFAIYMVLEPKYEPIVLASANAITLRMTPATEMRDRSPQKGWEMYTYKPETGYYRIRGWKDNTKHLILLSAILLPALLLATPAPVMARLKMFLISLPIMYVGHVLSIALLTHSIQSLIDKPGGFAWLVTLRLVYASGQMLSAALWVALSWRHWIAPAAAPTGKS